jgi:hypothetical protein
MSKTSLALSNLRGFVILIVLGFHSVLAYVSWLPTSRPAFNDPPYDWLSFPIVDSERWFGFDLFCAMQNLYLMSLMFFLSGLFVWPSLTRKGGATFAYDRMLRLGLPFALVVAILMPIAHYPVYRVNAIDPGLSAFWQHWLALPFWPNGPVWFLWELLVLNLAAAAVFVLAPRCGLALGRLSSLAGDHPARFFIGLVAASALAYLPLAFLFDPWSWHEMGPFGFQISRPLHYTIYFFAGLGIGAAGIERGLLATDGPLARRWALWFAVWIASFFLWIIPMALTIDDGADAPLVLRLLAEMGFVLACAGGCFFLTAVFIRFAAIRSRLLGSLSDNAYGMYLIHYAFVIWLQYALLSAPLFAVAKAAIVFIGTLTASWAVTVAMRAMPLGARLIGTERRALAKAP